MADLAFRLLQ